MHKPLKILLVLFLISCLAGCGTPLSQKAMKGDLNAVKTLVDKGADVNERTSCGGTAGTQFTALMCAAWAGNTAVVEYLLDHGADINSTYSRGYGTALTLAVEYRHPETARLLLERGANPNAKIGYSSGPYHVLGIAAFFGQTEIVKLLIERGADIDAAMANLERDRDKRARYGMKLLEKYAKKQEIASQPAMPKVSPAVPSHSIKSDVEVLPSSKAGKNKSSYAIVIGIEQYRQGLPKADFAVSDAKPLAKYLSHVMGYPEENIIVLINEHATKSDFEKYFGRWLLNNTEEESTVFVYYSGHGAPNPKTGDAYLVPYDGDPSFIEETGYSLRRLYAALEKLPAKEIVVALDSCFSGAGGRSVLAKGARPLVMTMETSIIPQKIAVLSAASGHQISSTYEEKGHGLFTYFLLKGIKEKAEASGGGGIELRQLFRYLKPQVEKIARRKYNQEQSPQLTAPKKQRIFLGM